MKKLKDEQLVNVVGGFGKVDIIMDFAWEALSNLDQIIKGFKIGWKKY